jgi:hypothetical protein
MMGLGSTEIPHKPLGVTLPVIAYNHRNKETPPEYLGTGVTTLRQCQASRLSAAAYA